jgi:hypothetical protein
MRRGANYTCRLCRTKLTLGGSIAPEPSKPVVREIPKATAPVAAPRSKAEVVKAAIKLFKQAGTALDQVLESNKVVQEIAAEAGLTAALCRTYLKNNWSKV